jgi:hypothetical protein
MPSQSRCLAGSIRRSDRRVAQQHPSCRTVLGAAERAGNRGVPGASLQRENKDRVGDASSASREAPASGAFRLVRAGVTKAASQVSEAADRMARSAA